MSNSNNLEVITASAERLSVSPGRSYRTWSRKAKDRFVGETFAPGANVSVVARSHGRDPWQLFA
ncbi:transposase [Bradyrhizobium sp. 45]|nr:transposase [Bradyrhizobium sp. 45]